MDNPYYTYPTICYDSSEGYDSGEGYDSPLVVPETRIHKNPPSVQLAGEMLAIEPATPSAQHGQQMTDCKYPPDVLEHMGPYRTSAQPQVPIYSRPCSPTTPVLISNAERLSHHIWRSIDVDPTPPLDEIFDVKELLIDMRNTEEMKKKIGRVTDEEERAYRHNVSWDEHSKGYALLHILRPTFCHVMDENLALKKKIKMLEKNATAQKSLKKARRENKYFLRSRKK